MGKWVIEGLDKANAILGHFSWTDFTAVRRFSLEALDAPHRVFDIDLVLESERHTENYALHLRFHDISGLSLKVAHKFMGLTIENIADRQWERQNWEVGQIEDSRLRFRAAEIEIVSLTRL